MLAHVGIAFNFFYLAESREREHLFNVLTPDLLKINLTFIYVLRRVVVDGDRVHTSCRTAFILKPHSQPPVFVLSALTEV